MTNAKLDFCRYLIFIIFSKKSLNTTMKCSFIIQQHTSLMVIISTQPTGGGCRPIAWRADLTLTNHAKSWSNADQSGGGRAVLRPPITLRGCFFSFPHSSPRCREYGNHSIIHSLSLFLYRTDTQCTVSCLVWGGGDGLESLLILARVDLGNDLLQLPLGLTLREVVHVVVLRCHPAQLNKNKL